MKKCLLIYDGYNIDFLFDSHPAKINLSGQWIALKNELYKNGIELISKVSSILESPDLEIHINVSKVTNSKWPKFCIICENKYIHPDNSNISLIKKYDHIFSWNPDLIDLGLATKFQLAAHPMGKGIIDGYNTRDHLVVLVGTNRSLRSWHPKNDLYRERIKTIRWFENNAPNDFALYGRKWNMSGRLPTRFGGLIHSLEKRLPFKHYPFPSWKGEILNKKDIIIADDGGHLTWTIQSFKVKEGQKLFSAFGNSPMGYALPASIGASIVKNKSRVICIDGDGSIQINLQELHTIDKMKLPIKIFILNNNGYGIIKQFQELYLGRSYEASGKGVSNPDFKKISSAFNINYNIIKNHKDLMKLKKIVTSKKPEIIEIKIRPNQKIIPKLQFGNPIEDLSPLLNRKEFQNNMDLDTIKSDKKIFEAN